jgi:S-sulfo-L-cysteine synthase (O-acetyl-L-serine-dependent)
MIYDRLINWIGNTPLTKLETLSSSTGRLRVSAKCEYLNPTGSSKARPARQMILDALAKETHAKDKRFLDSGSGGTAEAEAMVARRVGIGLDVVVAAGTPEAKLVAIEAYGAKVILSEAREGSEGARRMAAELAQSYPSRYIYLNQYANDSNWKAHLQTGDEIFEQTEGQVTHVYVGIGTGGTVTGIGRALRAKGIEAEIIGVMPNSADHKLAGLKYITHANKPPILDMALVDRLITVSDSMALSAMDTLAREEGLLVGPSSGAVLAAWLSDRNRVSKGVVVLLMHDDARKYPSLIGSSLVEKACHHA